MTEHFTRDEAVAMADRLGALQGKEHGCHETELLITKDDIHALLNLSVNVKLKEWEAQGAVAYAYDIFTEPACTPIASWQPVIDRDLRTDKPTRNIVPLYSHALPAQPAEPVSVNAELVEALKEITLIAEIEEMKHPRGSEWQMVGDLGRAAISCTQAAQPQQKEG
jgi:hypothetical protein